LAEVANNVMRKMLGIKKDEVTAERVILRGDELRDLHCHLAL
jgi:hypothetical protein